MVYLATATLDVTAWRGPGDLGLDIRPGLQAFLEAPLPYELNNSPLDNAQHLN